MTRMTKSLVLWVLMLSLATCGAADEATNRDRSDYTDMPAQRFPVRLDPLIVPATQASLKDVEMVIGVARGSDVRAYPVNLMYGPDKEAVNDTLGGTPVVTTWCPIAHSAGVYARQVAGAAHVFGVAGAEHGTLILYDKETGSQWSQIVGTALRGALTGRRLEKLPATFTTWGSWKRLHPETTVYVTPGAPYRSWFTEETFARIAYQGEGALRNEDLVVAVEGQGESARAYPIHRLVDPRVVNDAIDDVPLLVFLASDLATVRVFDRLVGGRTLTFRAAAGDRVVDEETRSVWDPIAGKALTGVLAGKHLTPRVSTPALWFAWKQYRPATVVWSLNP
jgi:Protein of unknown function (DUF3179)